MRQAAFARERGTTAMALAGAVALTLIIIVAASAGLWFLTDERSIPVLWLAPFTAEAVYALLREDSTRHQPGAVFFLLAGVGKRSLFTAIQVRFLLATAVGCRSLALSVQRPGLAADPLR